MGIAGSRFQFLSPSPMETFAGLQKIADDNNSDFLKEYITNKGYMNPENDSIQIYLDENISPARIHNLNLMMHSLRTLDVSAFDSLEYLIVNDASITSLDLSTLKRLKSVGLYNTGITNLNNVELPDNPELEVRGNIDLPLGVQVSEYEYQLISGTQVDLSAYATMNGEQANFVWKKRVEGRETVVEWKQTAPGIFTVTQSGRGGRREICLLLVRDIFFQISGVENPYL